MLVVGAAVLAAVYFFIVRKPAKEGEDERALIEVALPDRPIASLIPTTDGHWLKMLIEKISIPGAFSLDYELLYELPDGRSQGVPGTIKLDSQSKIERDLLLGSESSGKFRYDDGVSKGTLTLRFRNEKGKLVVKFVSGFHLQSDVREISSIDGKFTYTLDKTPTKTFFVTMETFGVNEMPAGDVVSGPYGVFTSGKTAPGIVKLEGVSFYRWDGSTWEKLEAGKSKDFGIFVGTPE